MVEPFSKREMREAWKAAGVFTVIKRSARAVLMYYLQRANDEGRAFPTQRMLEEDLGYSAGHLRRMRTMLVDLGLLVPAAHGVIEGQRVPAFRVACPADFSPDLALAQMDSEKAEQTEGVRARAHPLNAKGCAPARTPTDVRGARLARRGGARPGAHHVQERTRTSSEARAPVDREPEHPKPPDHSPSPDGLFDPHAAVALLMQRAGWTNGRPDGAARLDALRLVQEFGVERVRDAVRHADFLAVKGEIRKGYRHVIAHFLRKGWQLDERITRADRQAEAARLAEQRHDQRRRKEEARRAELDAAEQNDELLWSQLSSETRERLFRSVVATLPPGHMLAKLGAASAFAKPFIIEAARRAVRAAV